MKEKERIYKKINNGTKLTDREKFVIAHSYFENVDPKEKEECDRLYRFIKMSNFDPSLVRANAFYHYPGFGGLGSFK